MDDKTRNTKALKSGFWYIFANLLVRGMTIITTPIFARMMTKEQVGEYSNFYSWLTISVIVVTMRMEASLISAKYDYQDNLRKYNRSMIVLIGVSTIIWALILNAFTGFFSGVFGFGRLYINLLLLYCFFHSIINIFQMDERYQYRYKNSVLISILAALSSAICSVSLALTMENRLDGRVFGMIIPIVIIGFILLLRYFRTDQRISPAIWLYTLKISIPFIPHLLSLQVLNSVDRIMITRICGAADNALYTIAYTCGHMVTLLMTAMNSAYSPWLGDKLHEEDVGAIRKTTRYYTLLFSFFALGMMLLAPEILLIMGGRSYLEARFVMPPVAMGCVCQFLYSLYVNVEQFKKKTVGMAFASVTAGVLNYGLNAWLIPIYGYTAAAYTTLAGYLFLLLAHMMLVRKLRIGDLFDDRFIFFLVLVMSAVMVGVNFTYEHPAIRYSILGIYAAGTITAILLKRKQIRKIMRRIIK